MRVVAPIVEGDGEVAALPILLRRIGAWLSPEVPATIAKPIRVRRDRFLNRDEDFRRHLLLAAAKSGEGGWILVVAAALPNVVFLLWAHQWLFGVSPLGVA